MSNRANLKQKQKQKKKQKRNRKFLVCSECRRKKIKCDRRYPCSQCVKSELHCEYKTPGGVFTREPIISEDAEEHILDRKISKLKQTTLISKPSRTVFLGPLSQYRIIGTVPMFNFFERGLKNTLKEERASWKREHKDFDYNLNLLNVSTDEESLVKAIEAVICPDYYVFLQCLDYFQDNLNMLLYGHFVPVNVLRQLFLSRFRVTGTGVTFIRPEKCYVYADISAVTAIAHLVLIFTRYKKEGELLHLSTDTNELVKLTLNLLNTSQFKVKRTHEGLLSLIFLRSALDMQNSTGAKEEITSYPIFHICLEVCYQMGIHYDPDCIDTHIYDNKEAILPRVMSSVEIKALWNYMQTADAVYSIIMGSPLLINYEYCGGFQQQSDTFYERRLEEATILLREISRVGNSIRPISFGELLDQIKAAITFCSQIPFVIFSTAEEEHLDELAPLCSLKLLILGVIGSLCRMVQVGISNLSSSKSLNHDTLQSVVMDMNRVSFLCSSVSLFHILAVCEGKSSFGEEPDSEYIVYFRSTFSRVMGPAFILWYNCLFSRSVRNADHQIDHGYPPEGCAAWIGEVNIHVLENALYLALDQADGLCSRLVSTTEIMSFSRKMYNALCRNNVMKDSLGSFIMIRTGALWICALQTIEENRGKSNREKLTVAELVRQTRKRLRSGITLETPGGTSELGDEIAQSEKFFESILTDSDWLTSNFGDMDAGLFFDLEQTDSIISSGLVLPQDDSI